MTDKKILVKQVRGVARSNKKQKATLVCLGLGRPGKEAEHVATPATVGMIKSVSHMVDVTVLSKAKAEKRSALAK